MFWMIAIAQQKRYAENESVRKYAIRPQFIDAVRKIDEAYQLTPISPATDLVEPIADHPKLNAAYKLDPAHKDTVLWSFNTK